MALALLSALSPDQLALAILSQDKATLARADGVGPRLAGRIAHELRDTKIKVNSAHPGWVKTDMGGPMGAQKPVEEGAAGIVWLATLPDDGPTGGYFHLGERLPW